MQEFAKFINLSALRKTIDFQALTVLFPGGKRSQDVADFTSDLVTCLVDKYGIPAVAETLGLAGEPASTSVLVSAALEQLESRVHEGSERIYMRPAEMYFEYLVDVPFFQTDYNPRIRDFTVDGDLREFQTDALKMMSGRINPHGRPAGTFFKTAFRLDWTWASYFTGIKRIKHGLETYYCVHGPRGDPMILNNFYMTKDVRDSVSAAFRADESCALDPDWDKISYEFEHVKFEPADGRIPAGIPDTWKTVLRKITGQIPSSLVREVLAPAYPNVTSYNAYCFMVQFSFLFPVAVVPDMCRVGLFTIVDYVLFRRLAEYTLDLVGIPAPMKWTPAMQLGYSEIEVAVPKNATFVQCSDACNARIAEIAESGGTRVLIICNDDKHKKKLESLLKSRNQSLVSIACIDDLATFNVPGQIDTILTSVYRGMNRINALSVPEKKIRFITVHGGALTGILYPRDAQ